MQDKSADKVLTYFTRDNDWHSLGEVAQALAMSVPSAVSLANSMKNGGLLEFVRHPTNDARGGMYRITPNGQAYLAEHRIEADETFIGRRLRRVVDASGKAQPFVVAVNEPPIPEFDVFISYAGEDRDSFVQPLAEALESQSVRVWFDKDRLSVGDTKSKEIERAMRLSRFAAVILSRAFISKNYPDREYHTLLNREINLGQKLILPIIYDDLTDQEIFEYSPSLSDKYYLRAKDFTLEGLIDKILQVVKPPIEHALDELLKPSAKPSEQPRRQSKEPPEQKSGQPSDALPEQTHLLAFQPCLAITFADPQTVDGQFFLSWVIRNVGQGVARIIRIFLPGLTIDKPDAPLVVGEQRVRGTLYEDKHAFNQFMKPSVQLVAEFEDHAGNIYRQYAKVIQTSVLSGAFNAYRVEELGKPWLVPERIIPQEY